MTRPSAPLVAVAALVLLFLSLPMLVVLWLSFSPR